MQRKPGNENIKNNWIKSFSTSNSLYWSSARLPLNYQAYNWYKFYLMSYILDVKLRPTKAVVFYLWKRVKPRMFQLL